MITSKGLTFYSIGVSLMTIEIIEHILESNWVQAAMLLAAMAMMTTAVVMMFDDECPP